MVIPAGKKATKATKLDSSDKSARKETKEPAAPAKSVPTAGKKKAAPAASAKTQESIEQITIGKGAANKMGAFGESSVASSSLVNAFSTDAVKNVDIGKLFQKRDLAVEKRELTETDAAPTATDRRPQGRGKPTKSQRKSHLHDPLDKEECRHTVFVGNLPNSVNAKQLKKIFKDCGAIESVRIRSIRLTPDDRRVDRGRAVRCLRGEKSVAVGVSANGFVVFEDKGSVDAAVKLSGTVHLSHHISVTREDAQSKAFTTMTSLFLGNLAYTVSDEDIWRFFIDNGVKELERVRIVRDRETGEGRGIGYVQFKSPQAVSNAIGLRGKPIHDRGIRMTHVQKIKNEAIAKEASRREKRQRRQDDALEGQAPLPLHKKRRPEEAAAGQHRTSGRRAAVAEADGDAAAAVPSWMGSAANPRKKLARDLRPLTQSAEDRKKILRERKREAFASGRAKAGAAGGGGHKATKSGPQPRKSKA